MKIWLIIGCVVPLLGAGALYLSGPLKQRHWAAWHVVKLTQINAILDKKEVPDGTISDFAIPDEIRQQYAKGIELAHQVRADYEPALAQSLETIRVVHVAAQALTQHNDVGLAALKAKIKYVSIKQPPLTEAYSNSSTELFKWNRETTDLWKKYEMEIHISPNDPLNPQYVDSRDVVNQLFDENSEMLRDLVKEDVTYLTSIGVPKHKVGVFANLENVELQGNEYELDRGRAALTRLKLVQILIRADRDAGKVVSNTRKPSSWSYGIEVE